MKFVFIALQYFFILLWTASIFKQRYGTQRPKTLDCGNWGWTGERSACTTPVHGWFQLNNLCFITGGLGLISALQTLFRVHLERPEHTRWEWALNLPSLSYMPISYRHSSCWVKRILYWGYWGTDTARLNFNPLVSVHPSAQFFLHVFEPCDAFRFHKKFFIHPRYAKENKIQPV